MTDVKQIDREVLVSLVRKHSENKARVGEINGELGDRLKHHAEHSNLNTKAFRIIAQMHRMDEVKRGAFWDALLFYHDIMSEKVWDGHTGDLVDMAEEEVDLDAEAAAANEAALREGIRELPEEDSQPAAETSDWDEAAPVDRSPVGFDVSDEDRPPARTRKVREAADKAERRAAGDAAGTYKLN